MHRCLCAPRAAHAAAQAGRWRRTLRNCRLRVVVAPTAGRRGDGAHGVRRRQVKGADVEICDYVFALCWLRTSKRDHRLRDTKMIDAYQSGSRW